jgi:hypothetical protein
MTPFETRTRHDHFSDENSPIVGSICSLTHDRVRRTGNSALGRSKIHALEKSGHSMDWNDCQFFEGMLVEKDHIARGNVERMLAA